MENRKALNIVNGGLRVEALQQEKSPASGLLFSDAGRSEEEAGHIWGKKQIMNNCGITILNVDSPDSGLYVKSRILREAGYKVIEARTGAEALRLVAQASPRLVLLSVSLPDMSGLEVCRRIKADHASYSKAASALVLLVSASFVGCEKRARSLEDGADGYLLEPVTPEFLLANIKTLLRLRKDETEREQALADQRRQAWALKRLAQFAFDINSAETLDEILQIVTNEARELIGAHQSVASLAADLLAANVMAVNGDSPHAITAVSLSEKYADWRDFDFSELGARGAAWMRSLVCRMNQPMRLTQAELESQFAHPGSGRSDVGEPQRELLEDRAPGRLILPGALDGVMTPREFAALRELALSRELAALREVATPREVATLRELAPLRDSQMLPGLEMRGWLAAPLTSRDGRNLGLIQLSDKYDGEFTEQDEAILAQLARMVSIIIENRQLYRWEQDRRVAAENAARATNEFLAMVSHKLRTPLNAVLGWAWVLRRQTCGLESVARAAEIIERNARAQAQLVEDLMEVSRRGAGKLRLDLKPLEIAPLVVGACDNLRPAAEAKGVELNLMIDPGAGTIIGDCERLQQIVWNLLSNAIRLTPAGGHVELRLERCGANLQLTVSDTGKGFSLEALPFVFDGVRNACLDGALRRRGLGLGLVMVRHLVEMHGGSVSVSSPDQGCGATFVIKLPVNAVYAEREDEWRNGRAEEWENGRAVGWERNGAESSAFTTSHLPISYSPTPVSRGAAASGGC
jgi:signal transduction histidine kinase/DNA-binding response OmpR family regulator